MSINPLNDISRVYLEQVVTQEVEIDEGITLKDYKKKKSALKQKEKRAADKIAPGRRAGIHADKASPERAARHRANVDPDFEGNDERNYPGGKLKNPKKIRKAKALGELGESAVPGKPAERLGAVTAIPKSEQDAARERILAKTKAKREAMKEERNDEPGEGTRQKYGDMRGLDRSGSPTSFGGKWQSKERKDAGAAALAKLKKEETEIGEAEEKDPFGRPGGKYGGVKKGGGYDKGYQAMQKKLKELDKVKTEALDPVGQEDADIDNDGDTDKSDKYLHKRRKAIGKAIAKKKSVKEGFSNWRQDLSEVMTDEIDSKPIKEKKIKNKIKVNPTLGEAVENIGGTLIEMVEIEDLEGIFDEMTESDIFLLNDSLVEEVVEEVFFECLEEGYDVEDVENILIESLEVSSALLNEAKVTLGHDTKIQSDRLEKVKSAVKKTGKAIARGAGYVAGAAVRGAKAAKREFGKGYEKGRGGSSSSSETSSSSSSSTSSSENGTKRPGLLGRIASKLKSGLKKAVAKGARAVSRGARNVARKMEGGETKKAEAPKTAPKKAEKPADPWEGSATTPAKAKPKATTKKAAAPKAKAPAKKKKSSKLDDLLASVRNEEVQIDEKTLTKMEMKKREEIVKSMKDKADDFEKRYPGRGKEVMYATATKMAKKVAEQTLPTAAPTADSDTDKKKGMMDKQKLANMKMLQQKQQMLQKQKLQMQKSGRLPLETD